MKQHMHIDRFISDRNRPKKKNGKLEKTKLNMKTHENSFVRSLSIDCELTA